MIPLVIFLCDLKELGGYIRQTFSSNFMVFGSPQMMSHDAINQSISIVCVEVWSKVLTPLSSASLLLHQNVCEWVPNKPFSP
jgi:hypothetical protein